MGEIFATIIGVFILIGLTGMAILPMFKDLEDEGPWIVQVGEEYLIFHSPENWSTTSIVYNADKFDVLEEAEEWAKAVGGKVAPWAMVNP